MGWRIQIRMLSGEKYDLDYTDKDRAANALSGLSQYINGNGSATFTDDEGWAVLLRGDQIESAGLREINHTPKRRKAGGMSDEEALRMLEGG